MKNAKVSQVVAQLEVITIRVDSARDAEDWRVIERMLRATQLLADSIRRDSLNEQNRNFYKQPVK